MPNSDTRRRVLLGWWAIISRLGSSRTTESIGFKYWSLNCEFQVEKGRFTGMDVIQSFRRLGPNDGGEGEYGPFVASKLRPHFHRPDCEWAMYINQRNRLEFASHSEAVDAVE